MFIPQGLRYITDREILENVYMFTPLYSIYLQNGQKQI